MRKPRSHQWEQGRRNGVRWAVTWLHNRALEMNDPRAVLILNSAAFNLGARAKRNERLTNPRRRC